MSQIKNAQQDCFICRKHQGEIKIPGGAIYEDDLIYVGHAMPVKGTAYIGYIFIDLKRHVKGLDEMKDEEASLIGIMAKKLSKALKDCLNAEHVYLFSLVDYVPHFHLHVVPRYINTPEEYWGTDIMNWSDAPQGDSTEIEEVCIKIRNYIKEL